MPRWVGSPANGGWSFAVDPDASAEHAPAIWRPQLCALTAIAAPAPSGFFAAVVSDIAGAGVVAAELIAHREWHLILTIEGRRYRLWIADCERDEPLAYVVPADRHVEVRQAATRGLHRRIAGRSPPHMAACGQPGSSERWRLAQWLRLLDGLEENVSPRELAAALILADARHYSAAEWDASSERRRIVRWQRGAIAMRDGGYRRLLGGG